MDTEGSLLETLKKKKRSELVSIANEKYGLLIDDKLDEETIAQIIFDIDQESKNKAVDLNRESARLVVNEEDPLITVKFMPQEFPNADYEFCFDSGRGVKKKGEKAKSPKGMPHKRQLDKMPHYHLFPMQTYDLPLSVMRHLEKLTFQDNAPVYDPMTGQITGNMPIIKPRFILIVQQTDEQLKSLGKTKVE